MAAKVKIRIGRIDGGWVDRARPYDVVVNDVARGRLRRGEETEIDVDPGVQVVYLKLDWCRSKSVRLELEPGEEVELRCKPRSPLTVLYGITLGRKNYMSLVRV